MTSDKGRRKDPNPPSASAHQGERLLSGSGAARPRFYSEIVVGGIPLDELSSAAHKAIRRGEVLDAAYWVRHLVVHGFGRYALKKLAIVAAEDVGLGDPQAVLLANALLDLAVRVTAKANPTGDDLRGAELHIVGAAVVLARAKHNRVLAEVCCLAAFHAKHGPRPEIPEHAVDMHTRRGRSTRGLKRGSKEALRWWQERSRIVSDEVVLDNDASKIALDAAWEIDPTIGFIAVEPDGED